MLTHLRSIGRIFNGGLSSPLTMGRLAQRRQAEPLFSFLKKSRALCRMSVLQPAVYLYFVFVFVVCRVSVWGESYAGKLCMCHLPLNLRLNTQSRTLGLRNEQILHLNFLFDSRLPSAALLQAFSCRNYFLGTLWVDDENSELQLFAIYEFLHVDAVEYS